jgi:hypothetical protein
MRLENRAGVNSRSHVSEHFYSAADDSKHFQLVTAKPDKSAIVAATARDRGWPKAAEQPGLVMTRGLNTLGCSSGSDYYRTKATYESEPYASSVTGVAMLATAADV